MEQFARFLGPEAPSLAEVFPETAARIEELRSVARYSGLFAALVLLLKDQSFLGAYPLWNRKSALANLWKGLDLVREYENVFGNDPAGCAAYVARMAGRKGAGEESTPLGEEEDVVRVLTVHSAKGLEFPITVVMDLNNTPGGGGGRGALVPSALLGAGASRHPEAWSEKSASETGKIARFLRTSKSGRSGNASFTSRRPGPWTVSSSAPLRHEGGRPSPFPDRGSRCCTRKSRRRAGTDASPADARRRNGSRASPSIPRLLHPGLWSG